MLDALSGEDGVLAGLRRGAIHIGTSTILRGCGALGRILQIERVRACRMSRLEHSYGISDAAENDRQLVIEIVRSGGHGA